jgi:hypothetical protein
MATYAGGARSAEVIATDGAGNTTAKHWTINVDPEGRITTNEAKDTLEAVDTTSETTVVAPTKEVLEPGQIENGDNPGLYLSGSDITSTGVPDTTTMTTDPGDGFTVQSPEEAITITPVVSENASPVSITEGVAGVSANIETEVDSVIRPEYNGDETFQAIRSDSSPETYSWIVHISAKQKLISVNSTQAEVVYADGTRAFLISAETAHDATGTSVPTSLEVNGEILTLIVDFHSGHYVYPIVAGQSWETSYQVPVIEKPEEIVVENNPPVPSESPLTKAEAKRIISPGHVNDPDIAAPPYPPAGEASDSAIRPFHVEERFLCSENGCGTWKIYIAAPIEERKEPTFIRGYNWAHWNNGTEVRWGHTGHFLSGIFDGISEDGGGFTGPWKVYKGEDKHLTIWSRFDAWAWVITDLVQEEFHTYYALQVWVWPNGYQQKYLGRYDPHVNEL